MEGVFRELRSLADPSDSRGSGGFRFPRGRDGGFAGSEREFADGSLRHCAKLRHAGSSAREYGRFIAASSGERRQLEFRVWVFVRASERERNE